MNTAILLRLYREKTPTHKHKLYTISLRPKHRTNGAAAAAAEAIDKQRFVLVVYSLLCWACFGNGLRIADDQDGCRFCCLMLDQIKKMDDNNMHMFCSVATVPTS